MEIWKHIKPGQPPSFKSPEEMWERALKYFEDCKKDTSLAEAKPFAFQGGSWLESVPKMRAMTQHGLCAYLNISVSTWHNYKDKPEYLQVTGLIEQVIYEQKFSGAAAGLLNANIIARDLGLADKQEIAHGGEITPWTSIKAKVDE